jgi:maleate cis-trans isomerase
VDLGKRMHKILNIAGENASCVVEPGVTYFKFYEDSKPGLIAPYTKEVCDPIREKLEREGISLLEKRGLGVGVSG